VDFSPSVYLFAEHVSPALRAAIAYRNSARYFVTNYARPSPSFKGQRQSIRIACDGDGPGRKFRTPTQSIQGDCLYGGLSMYVTIFDTFIPYWKNLQVHTRALIVGVAIIAVTILLGSLSVLTHYHFSALITLGVFYGIVLSKILSQFLAPKIQSLVAGFLSGITAGNIGVQQARVSAAIHNVANGIQGIAQNIASGIVTADADFNLAIVWGVWIALLTAIMILAANAYYANLESSPVGEAQPVQPASDGVRPGPELVRN